MTVHIWCPRPSDSARALQSAISSLDVRCHKTPGNRNYAYWLTRFMRRLKEGDLWVNWGPGPNFTELYGNRTPDSAVDFIENGNFLNRVRSMTKRTQLVRLAEAEVNVPRVFTEPGRNRIGRSNYHVGGSDLLAGTGRDYYTEKLDFRHEFRIHVFRGVSIRAGLKVHRPGVCAQANRAHGQCLGCEGVPRDEYTLGRNALPHGPHPWIRTYEAGWRLDYGQACQRVLRQVVRDEAKKAVEALGLDFGAVDVGYTADRRPVVLEVNLAPGLDQGPSVEVYARKIIEVHNAG